MLDVTATAAANNVAQRDAASAACTGDGSGALGAFRALVASSAVSTNVSADKVTAFEGTGQIMDSRQLLVRRAGGDEAAGLAEFAAVQGPWLGRRQGFEDLWLHGRRFVYGAVNAGGMGTEGEFGPFCLVAADPTSPTPDALAVFPGDSASRYGVAGGGPVDAGRARAEVASWAARGDLAVASIGDEARRVPSTSWPGLVCAVGRYFEVVRAGNWPVTGVTEVRLRAAFRRQLVRLSALYRARASLSARQRNLVAAYTVALRWQKSHGLAITELPNL